MGAHSLYQSFFLLFLLFSVSFCSAVDKIFEVVGTTECADCNQHNLQSSLAFSGLRVTVDCKLKNGDKKTFAASKLDNRGEFKVQLPKELVQDGRSLKEECHAQLHSTAALPCPTNDGVEASNLVLKSETDQKTTFAPAKNLQFSAALCSSKNLLPLFPHHPHHPWFHPMPINEPEPEPEPEPNPPVVKPLPPPVPIYEPIVNPLPPTVPIDEPEPKPPVDEPKPKPPKPHKPQPKPPVDEPKPPHKSPPKPKPPVDEPKPKPRKPEPNPPVDKPEPKPPVVKPVPPPVPIYNPPPVVNPVPPTEPVYSPPPSTVPIYGPPPAYKPLEVVKPLLNK